MSRGDGRALDAMARTLYEMAPAEMRTNLEGGAIPWERANLKGEFRQQAQAAYDAILGALLSELPEEAVKAMMESGGRGSTNTTRQLCERWLTAALLSLRSSSRGAKTDED